MTDTDNVDELLHGLAPGNVLNPQIVKNDIGNLDGLHPVDADEHGIEEGNPLHNQLLTRGASDIDTITHVVRVFDE